MKAKFYEFGTKKELVLKTGETYTIKKGESVGDFTKRISEDILEELDIQFVDIKSTKNSSTVVLEKQAKFEIGLKLEMINEVLKLRGVAVQEPKKETEELTEKQIAITAFRETKVYTDHIESIGKSVTFTQKNTSGEQKGIIKSLSLNKALTKVYFVVAIENGKRKCCTVESVKFEK